MVESEFDKSRAVTYSGIPVDIETHVARLEDGRTVQLTPREFRALSAYGKLTARSITDVSKELASIMNQLAEAEKYAGVAHPKPIKPGNAREAIFQLSQKLGKEFSLKKT